MPPPPPCVLAKSAAALPLENIKGSKERKNGKNVIYFQIISIYEHGGHKLRRISPSPSKIGFAPSPRLTWCLITHLLQSIRIRIFSDWFSGFTFTPRPRSTILNYGFPILHIIAYIFSYCKQLFIKGLFPCVLGHEAAAVVESVGDGVTSVKQGK